MSWRDNKLIDERSYKYLYGANFNLARCYGLPKIHKPGYPLRIIVSAIGSPTYNIAYFLHKMIKDTVPESRSYIGDSWKFVDVRNRG